MKVFKIDRKHNFFEIEPETLDDLWVTNLVIGNNDLIGSKTTRRFRIPGSKDSEKKTVFIKVELEKKELDLKAGVLKITGITREGHPEQYVDINSYHSIEILEGTKISVNKTNLLDFEINLLKEAKANLLLPKIYLLILDDDSTLIARANVRKFDIIATIGSGKAGKRMESLAYRNKYFSEIYSALESREKDLIVVGGPGFEKEHFEKYISNKPDKKKFRFTHINSTGITGLNELLKGGSVKNILDEFKIQKDSDLMTAIMTEIAKEGAVSYGFLSIRKNIKENAVKELLVTDNFFMDHYDDLRNIFIKLERLNVEYHIIASDTDAGNQLNNIGGIAALLYYKS